MIQVAETCGMCAGANHAYQKVIELLDGKRSGRVIMYKKLLHNRDAIEGLRKRGALFAEALPADVRDDDVIVIRAHGESRDFFAELERKKTACLDCTCRKVKKIHQLIAEKHAQGYAIVIIGDRDHAEVAGSNGWCNNTALVAASTRDIDRAEIPQQKIFVIAQTTFNEAQFKLLSKHIAGKFPGRVLEIHDSLCGAQRKIHDDSSALAARCKTMIILGSRESANTTELYRKCKSILPQTLLFEDRQALYTALTEGTIDLEHAVGLTGGASTPKAVIQECKALLEWTAFHRSVYPKIRWKLQAACAEERDSNAVTDGIWKQFDALALSAKAKYIRGALVMLGYKIACGGKPSRNADIDAGLDLAAAFELFETSILIHDDVFDNAAKRRGIATIHKNTEAYYRKAAPNARKLISEAASAAALCAGDAGFYLANSMVLRSYAGHKHLARTLAFFQELVITTIKGEMLDILLPLEERLGIGGTEPLEKQVRRIAEMKTAEYTTAGPLVLGLMLGGAGDAEIQKMRDFAIPLGIAFQIKDDLIDVFGSDAGGKGCGKDIAEYKMTLLYASVCKDAALKKRLAALYGKKVTKESLLEVRAIFEEAGAREAAEKEIEACLEKSARLLKKMEGVGEEERKLLQGFMILLKLRMR